MLNKRCKGFKLNLNTISECKDESNFCNITAIDICSSTKTNKFCLATCGLCDDDITTDNNDITTVTPTEGIHFISLPLKF
ncbi:unnamed protein product [Brugia timori]|uniref:ShKT domain-containing protein n=1 Tax=Brugia timori TaxID=42155 RepID=A0A3P7XF81_9BILA|nr:unnamed protein product [Brugia timori]